MYMVIYHDQYYFVKISFFIIFHGSLRSAYERVAKLRYFARKNYIIMSYCVPVRISEHLVRLLLHALTMIIVIKRILIITKG